jgi:hypothetical protein
VIRPLHSILGAIAATAVIAPALVVAYPPVIPQPVDVRAKLPPRRVLSQAELPPVEPVRLVDLSLDDARAFNETIPFVTGPNPPARPFRFAGSIEDRARALDCLAAGVIYEAGDDTLGQRSVAQVILNRLRHPAFPKTVCGVVFEGQDRSTGCQFTFSCDGAITRWQPSEAGWKRAREVAELALSGAVFPAVGYATHYHTDWVVPYWQSSLDKLARVRTHLFFRWTGWWGTPPAFNRQRTGAEPVIEKLAAISSAHRTGAAMEDAGTAMEEAVAAITGEAQLPVEGDIFLQTLPSALAPDAWPSLALAACGDRPICRYSAWTDAKKTPGALPLVAEQIANMSFSYIRDRELGLERTLWNCREVKRPAAQCMKQQVLMSGMPIAPAAVPVPVPTKGPVELDGIRRSPRAVPTPAAVPTPTASPSPKPGR